MLNRFGVDHEFDKRTHRRTDRDRQIKAIVSGADQTISIKVRSYSRAGKTYRFLKKLFGFYVFKVFLYVFKGFKKFF